MKLQASWGLVVPTRTNFCPLAPFPQCVLEDCGKYVVRTSSSLLRTAWSLRVLVTMTSARIVYTPLDIKPEQARDARALALRFVFDCYAKKKAEGRWESPDGRDGTTVQGDSANAIIR